MIRTSDESVDRTVTAAVVRDHCLVYAGPGPRGWAAGANNDWQALRRVVAYIADRPEVAYVPNAAIHGRG